MSTAEQESFLKTMRSLANATSEEDFLDLVKTFRKSELYKNSKQVERYVETYWLSRSEVSTLRCS